MFGSGNSDGPFAKGPGAMEKMIANMLGFTPEQMHETLTGFRDMIVNTKETLDRIEAKVNALQEAQNGNGTDGGNRGGGGQLLIGSGGPDAGERDAA